MDPEASEAHGKSWKPHPDDEADVREALESDHGERLSGLLRTIDEGFDGVDERLDRLIAVTMEVSAARSERLDSIERRLARLEERVGV